MPSFTVIVSCLRLTQWFSNYMGFLMDFQAPRMYKVPGRGRILKPNGIPSGGLSLFCQPRAVHVSCSVTFQMSVLELYSSPRVPLYSKGAILPVAQEESIYFSWRLQIQSLISAIKRSQVTAFEKDFPLRDSGQSFPITENSTA